jgi:hypothetical protein
MFEMSTPTVAPRVKQPDNFVRVGIATGEVRALVQVALVAGERKVFKGIRATVLARIDVLDVKRVRVVVFLPETAILTAIPGALPHLLAESRAHHEAP